MRKRPLFILLVTAGLLTVAWLFYSSTPPPNSSDLSVVFLGLTNNPGSSVASRRFHVEGNGRGLHALFAISNVTRKQYLNFGINAVETQSLAGWKADGPVGDQEEMGKGFPPGYGYQFAIPWPATVQTNTPWRLRLWVNRERRLLSIRLHVHTLGRSVLGTLGRHTITSETVIPSNLAVADPGASTANPQAQP